MDIIEQLTNRLEELYEDLENDEYNAEQGIIDLEVEIENLMDEYHGEKQKTKKLLNLHKKIKAIKEEFDFYDEEAELNAMFPNQDDDDLDYERSVF